MTHPQKTALLIAALLPAALLGSCGGDESLAEAGADDGPPAPGAEEPAGEPAPFSTPEEVVAHLRAADTARSFGGFIEVIPEAHRASFVWAAWFGAAYAAISGGAAEIAYEEINAEFGLDPEWLSKTSGEPVGREGLAELADQAFEGVDLEALFEELALLGTEPGESFFGFDDGDPTVTTTGERATAALGKAELTLGLLDGRWYWLPRGFEDE